MSKFKVGDRVLAKTWFNEKYQLGTIVQLHDSGAYAVIFDHACSGLHDMCVAPELKCPSNRGYFCQPNDLKPLTVEEEETNSSSDDIKDLWVENGKLAYDNKFLRTENADLKNRVEKLEYDIVSKDKRIDNLRSAVYEYEKLKIRLREMIK